MNTEDIIEIIENSLEGRKELKFDYKNMYRIVLPHFYGILGEIKQLHAFQTAGLSSGKIPDWRNFKLNEIKNIIETGRTFDEPGNSDYNPSGKHEYTSIIKQIYFTKPEPASKRRPSRQDF